MIENWKNAGIPLEAVLKGIDETFEKWRSRKIKRRLVNSIAYCAQAVWKAAERTPSKPRAHTAEPLFAIDELHTHLEKTAKNIRLRPEAPFQEVACSLDLLAANIQSEAQNLEELERRLTVLEEKLVAAVRSIQNDSTLYQMRQQLDQELRPFRSKMTAAQLAVLERRYLDSALLERVNLPRLSLFYLH